MKKCFLIPFVLSLSTNALAVQKDIAVKKGMAYKTANNELRRSGWSARRIHAKNEYTYIGIENTMLSQV
jgi:hypothetical protein